LIAVYGSYPLNCCSYLRHRSRSSQGVCSGWSPVLWWCCHATTSATMATVLENSYSWNVPHTSALAMLLGSCWQLCLEPVF